MKVVVAIDGLGSAKAALEYLESAKYGSDTEVLLVHAVVPGFADVNVAGIPDVVAIERRNAQRLLDETVCQLKDSLGVTVSTAIVPGEASEVVAQACKDMKADEVIVPSHERHGFKRFWFGSVAEEVAEATPCSVVMLKIPQSV